MADLALHYVSQCSGGGGLDIGFERAFRPLVSPRPILYSEREVAALEVLASAWRQGSLRPAPIWSDLASFPGRGLGRIRDELGGDWALVAGFPCQPWSTAGERKGVDDDRWIWPAIARWVGAARPGIVALENVPRLVTAGGLGYVVDTLEQAGLHTGWCGLRAADVGASHSRDRAWILGVSPRWRRILADSDGFPAWRELRQRQRQVAAAGGRLADAEMRRINHVPAGESDSGRRDEELADGDGRGALEESERYRRARRSGEELGDADLQQLDLAKGAGPNLRNFAGADQELGDAYGIERRVAADDRRRAPGEDFPDYPPGPEELEAWRRILRFRPGLAPASQRGGGPSQVVLGSALPRSESVVRLMAHGLGVGLARRDWIHVLGNGVVPGQAAEAFSRLLEHHIVSELIERAKST